MSSPTEEFTVTMKDMEFKFQYKRNKPNNNYYLVTTTHNNISYTTIEYFNKLVEISEASIRALFEHPIEVSIGEDGDEKYIGMCFAAPFPFKSFYLHFYVE